MAKGQQRSTKEQRKPKGGGKKQQAAKSLRPHELIQQTKVTGGTGAGQKK